MKLDDILDMWDTDTEIDKSELGEEARKIPRYHAKYLRMFARERMLLKVLEADYRKLIFDKTEFISVGVRTNAALEAKTKTWKTIPDHNRKVIKSDINTFLEGDLDVDELRTKKDFSQTKIDALKTILDSVMTRNFILTTIQKDQERNSGGKYA